MELLYYDRIIAIKLALRLGNIEFGERLIPPGSFVVHYAADCPRPEMVAKKLDDGYLNWSEKRATTAMKNCAGSGNVELMQQICQLHSPLRKDRDTWRTAWREALKPAYSNDKLSVLMWLIQHPLGQEESSEMKKASASWRSLRAKLLSNAAKKGHIRVMQYLHDQGLATDTIRLDSIPKYHLDSVKWLTAHDLIGNQRAFSCAIAIAAHYGRLDILQLFQVLDVPGGYEAVGLKRRRTGQSFSLWGGERDTFYWAAHGGHVHVLEWLQINYPAECDKDVMDTAACFGHQEAVKWLHANRTEGCSSNAMYRAARNGHYDVVKWLYVNRSESRLAEAIVMAIRCDHFRIAYFSGPPKNGHLGFLWTTLKSDWLTFWKD